MGLADVRLDSRLKACKYDGNSRRRPTGAEKINLNQRLTKNFNIGLLWSKSHFEVHFTPAVPIVTVSSQLTGRERPMAAIRRWAEITIRVTPDARGFTGYCRVWSRRRPGYPVKVGHLAFSLESNDGASPRAGSSTRRSAGGRVLSGGGTGCRPDYSTAAKPRAQPGNASRHCAGTQSVTPKNIAPAASRRAGAAG